MKKIILLMVVISLIAAISVGFAGCKTEMPDVNSDFEDVPSDAVIATGLSALTLFDEAIANTYEGNYKRVNTLDFLTVALGEQRQLEVASYYKIDDTYMRTVAVQASGSIAAKNTGVKLFYYDGETAKIAERTGKKVVVNFESADFDQLSSYVENCNDTEERLEDYDHFTSYVRTTDKLASDHSDEVRFKGDLYYATIKFKMNVGTENSGIQEAIDRAVESATGAVANSINWTADTVWNCIFIKIGDDFYLKKTYLYENYEGKQEAILGAQITAPCTQSHISEFSYGEDIDMPEALITLLGME